MKERYTILICDDSEALREGLSLYLEEEGHHVLTAENGHAALDILNRRKVDVLLLDIMMPGMDGYDTCRRIRSFSDVYIIILSARSQEIDRVFGLEVGADDYVTKPFSSREIMMRIERAMERIRPRQQANELSLAELSVMPETFQVFISGEEIHLSSKEFTLLHYMITNKGKVLTRENILNAVWNFDYYGDTRVIDGIVKRLRKKLNRPDVHFSLKTIYGIGYKLSEDER